MNIDLEIQFATTEKTLPHPAQLKEWVAASLEMLDTDLELCIRVVDLKEMKELNKMHRNKNQPTNILSFPNNIPEDFILEYDDPIVLGDIVICAPYVAKEASQLNIPLLEHWAHLIVHGCLHLTGYTHDSQKQALKMELLETKILTTLGYAEPYND